MYEEYFGLKTKPFSIVPDPHYFYMSTGHSEALAHLLYGINSEGGFVLLTGEVGTGKTTVCRRLIELLPAEAEVAFILNPKMSAGELLATVCDEFGINYPQGNTSIKVFVALINDYLLSVHEKGRRAVLIIEEAQNLLPDVLEQIRLLTNLETNQQKLLQIIMLGQPELREMLDRPQLRQLSQRITARYHLGPLTEEETITYVKHRLSVAGLLRGQLFPPPVLKKLFHLAGGIPRLINVICDRALLGGYVQGKEQVDMETLITAAREVSGKAVNHRRKQAYYAAAGLILVLCVVAILYLYRLPSLPATGDAAKPLVAEKTETARDSLVLPANVVAPATRDMAYAALFKEWGVEYSRGDARTVCDQAGKQGLDCVKGKGNISDLREMNKPVVLSLHDEKDDAYYGTLTRLHGELATLAIGNETRNVHIGEIIDRWSGDYLLLWRTPPGYQGSLKPGSRGPAVSWLERQLALVQGKAAPAVHKEVYDDEMKKQVKKFQLSAGLMPDGVAGQRTILRLSGAVPTGKEPGLSIKGSD